MHACEHPRGDAIAAAPSSEPGRQVVDKLLKIGALDHSLSVLV
jgi:hypothetical protein